jgi:hypothetical protein
LLLGDSAEFVQNRPGPDHRYPIFWFPLTLTHPRFKRLGGYWLVRKNPNIKATFTTNVLIGSDPTGFDRLGTDPTAL